MVRSVAQMATGKCNIPYWGEVNCVYALCNDGTIWMLHDGNKGDRWERVPKVPLGDVNALS
jgi:hypothetical protein